jgi:tetratricopeptide (TPR) repeat protein
MSMPARVKADLKSGGDGPRRLPLSAEPVGLRLDSIGQRLRTFRLARGLTQAQLAAGRFSKEYVSQIERGVSHPNASSLAWLAERLGVDHDALETGTARFDRLEAEQLLNHAEAVLEEKRFEEALALVTRDRSQFSTPQLTLRALFVESWAVMYLGDIQRSIELLKRAEALVWQHDLSEPERADVLYRLGCCHYKQNQIEESLALFRQALELANQSPYVPDRLRVAILERRARCYRRLRDWVAAREDIEAALELARLMGDARSEADVFFQASLVSDRSGNWIRARSQAEHARQLYHKIGDRLTEARLLNNLGCFNFLLGKTDDATALLRQAFAMALEADSLPDAGQAVSSLAQIHLRRGERELAEEYARQALEFLSDREDFADEIGNAQLVLGRALLEQGRLDEAEAALKHADHTLGLLSSASHQAAAWVAQADLAVERGDYVAAAARFKEASKLLEEPII